MSNRTIENQLKKDRLWIFCEDFIRKQEINCSEICYQSDNTTIEAPEFIEGICKIVGFYKE